ncbi:hypothetical protein SNEBB_005564 [Seison nebaliae]|nr:hypothetical protein SNEBB_005564 [Seison nebaliae]
MSTKSVIYANSIDEIEQLNKQYKDKEHIFNYFTSTKNSDGSSWCPDCVKAEPIILKQIEELHSNSVLIYCRVGNRDEWKAKDNPFRTQFKLDRIPTLSEYRTPRRIMEEMCSDESMVHWFLFEDVDDETTRTSSNGGGEEKGNVDNFLAFYFR